jgi:hypothetical protein
MGSDGIEVATRKTFHRQYRELSELSKLNGVGSFFFTCGLATPTAGRHKVLADFCLFLPVPQLRKESFLEIFLVLSLLSSSSMDRQIMEYVFCIPTE